MIGKWDKIEFSLILSCFVSYDPNNISKDNGDFSLFKWHVHIILEILLLSQILQSQGSFCVFQ